MMERDRRRIKYLENLNLDQGGNHCSLLLGKKVGRFLTNTIFVALGALGVILSLSLGTAGAEEVRLTGSLIIDWSEIKEAPIPQVESIQIPDQRWFLGERVPRWVESIPFRGEQFSVDFYPCFNNGDDGIGNGGMAYLVVEERRRGKENDRRLVLKANITRGIRSCLESQNSGKFVVPDPFSNNPGFSRMASMILILNQIFRSDPDGNFRTNETELREFFHIPEISVLSRARIGEETVQEIGSGSGVVSHPIMLRFQEGGSPNLISDLTPKLQ